MRGEEIKLRYSGLGVANHKMDVAVLAPALMAFGALAKESNRVINGDRASVRVLVNADIDANCVTISFDIVWSLLDQARMFIQDQRVSTAKEILEWIGILGLTGGSSLFCFLRMKKDKPIERQVTLTNDDGKEVVQINIHGDGNVVTVPPQVQKLAADQRVIDAVQGVMRPVVINQGIEAVSFYSEDVETFSADKQFAVDIMMCAANEQEPENVQEIVGHIRVHSAVFDPYSKAWQFEYLGNVVKVDISSTSIARDALSRGKVVVGDTYKVRLEITERKTSAGYKPAFKIVEVLDFIPGNEQRDLVFEENSDHAGS